MYVSDFGGHFWSPETIKISTDSWDDVLHDLIIYVSRSGKFTAFYIAHTSISYIADNPPLANRKRKSKKWNRKSRIENQKSKIKNSSPKFENSLRRNRKSRIENRKKSESVSQSIYFARGDKLSAANANIHENTQYKAPVLYTRSLLGAFDTS